MRRSDGWVQSWATAAETETETKTNTVSFVQKLAASDGFKSLFKEGMGLVEESAAYLDGPGREESRLLPRPAALAYATESMRLTTRLMQVASWLLLQRAVNEGELTSVQALSEKHRVRLAEQDIACSPELFEELPVALRQYTLKSIRLQARVAHLDQSMTVARERPPMARLSAVATQYDRLREAFAS
jgi:regulator of CtrA degradation